jgi:superfamily II DNA or RNA helicase
VGAAVPPPSAPRGPAPPPVRLPPPPVQRVPVGAHAAPPPRRPVAIKAQPALLARLDEATAASVRGSPRAARAVVPMRAAPTTSRAELFEHQVRSVDALARWWAEGSPAGLLCLPTGAGKTRVAVTFGLRHAVSSARIVWLTHRRELVDQASRTFQDLSAEAPGRFSIGLLTASGSSVMTSTDVIVASIPYMTTSKQKLKLLAESTKDTDLIVVDECHHAVAPTWAKLIAALRQLRPGSRLLGLSATPTRSVDHEQPRLWRIFDQLVHEEPILPLIQQQILSRPSARVVSTDLSFEATSAERKQFAAFDDLPPSLANKIAADEDRNARVVRTFLDEREAWGQTLVFATNNLQGATIAALLREHGVRVADIYGDATAHERHRVVDDFREGRLQVIVNVGLFTEGTDLPKVETVFLARPTRSRILFRQMVGRAMRGLRVGGSATCSIVAFSDEVVGLLADNLTSCFRDEHEMLEALGLPELDPDPVHEPLDDELDASLVRPDLSVEDMTERLRHRAASLAGTDEGDDRLLGWWEARSSAARSAYLPVFEQARRVVDAWVARVSAGNASQGGSHVAAPADAALPEEVFDKFAAAMRSRGARATWVDLALVDEVQIRAVAAALETVGLVDEMTEDDEVTQIFDAAPSRALAALEASASTMEARDHPPVAPAVVRVADVVYGVGRNAYSAARAIFHQHCGLLPEGPEENDSTHFVNAVIGKVRSTGALRPCDEEALAAIVREAARARLFPEEEHAS